VQLGANGAREYNLVQFSANRAIKTRDKCD